MFDPMHVEGTTAFFRCRYVTFDPEADGWWLQRFNARRMKRCV
jgi:hypothetical protein